MKKSRNPLVVLVLTATLVLAVWKIGGSVFSNSSAKKADHLVNRVWIDHMPTSSRDMIAHVVLIDHEQGQFGATGRSSQWRHQVDVFLWRLEGKQLSVFFPQDQVRARVQVKTWRCAGEAPQPFELCLRVSDPQHGEGIILYSREDWVIDAGDPAGSAAALASREPGLAGLIGPAGTLRSSAHAAPDPAALLDIQEWPAGSFFDDF